VPNEFAAKITLEQHQKAADYTTAKLKVNHLEILKTKVRYKLNGKSISVPITIRLIIKPTPISLINLLLQMNQSMQ
jgi:hypothetical protein